MKKLSSIISATAIACCLMVAPAFASDQANIYETKEDAQVALDKAKAEVPETQEITKEEVIKLEDKVVTDKEAYDETIEHPAVTHEETVIDEEAWDEQVCTPGTDPYGYKVDGNNRDGFTVEEGAFVLIKQASDYVIIWSEDAEFSDYPTAKEIAIAAKDGSVKDQQVIKWKGLGEFYPGNLGQPWHHWYGFCKNSEGIYFWVDNISGISHADVYVPGKPGECIEVHHGRIVHYETVVDEEAWTETIHHDATTHQVQQWTYVLDTIDKPINPTPVPTPVINDDQPAKAVQYIPKTGDILGDIDTKVAILVIVIAGAAFLLIANYLGKK